MSARCEKAIKEAGAETSAAVRARNPGNSDEILTGTGQQGMPLNSSFTSETRSSEEGVGVGCFFLGFAALYFSTLCFWKSIWVEDAAVACYWVLARRTAAVAGWWEVEMVRW